MISVIVPVYNVELYIDECVQSILSQTYKDFELILVDDGSTDNSGRICDDYKKKDNRILVIHKANGGLSCARNAGTAIANGDYITYIDSDDYVSKDYLYTLARLQKENDADIVVTGIAMFDEGKQPNEDTTGKIFTYTGEKAMEKMLYQDTIDTSACAMLIPIDIARKYPFPVGKYHEDDFTTYKYYSSVNKVVITTQKQYYYLQRKGSIMHVFGQPSLDELDAADHLVDFCKENYPDIVPAAESKKFSNYCQVLLMNSHLKNDNPSVYRRIDNYLKSVRAKITMDKKCRMKNRIAAVLLLFGSSLLEITNRIKN